MSVARASSPWPVVVSTGWNPVPRGTCSPNKFIHPRSQRSRVSHMGAVLNHNLRCSAPDLGNAPHAKAGRATGCPEWNIYKYLGDKMLWKSASIEKDKSRLNVVIAPLSWPAMGNSRSPGPLRTFFPKGSLTWSLHPIGVR